MEAPPVEALSVEASVAEAPAPSRARAVDKDNRGEDPEISSATTGGHECTGWRTPGTRRRRALPPASFRRWASVTYTRRTRVLSRMKLNASSALRSFLGVPVEKVPDPEVQGCGTEGSLPVLRSGRRAALAFLSATVGPLPLAGRLAPAPASLRRSQAPAFANRPACPACPGARAAFPGAAPPAPCEAARETRGPTSTTGPEAIPRNLQLPGGGGFPARRCSRGPPTALRPTTRETAVPPVQARLLRKSSVRTAGCQPANARMS